MPPIKLQFNDTGSADRPAIVFIHGFPFNQSMWKRQTELCKPQWRIITYDQRGHGKSDVAQGRYLFEFFVDDLFDLLDKLKVKRAVLCGLSMGGYVALRAAERHPERVHALVLCDTRSEADSDAAKLNRAADLRLIQEKGLEAFADKFLKKALAPSTFSDAPSVAADVRQMIVTNPLDGVQGTLIALATRTDTTTSLENIRAPTLILVGEQDVITPPSAAASLQNHIANAQMFVIPQAGHLSAMENQHAFNAHLNDFLKLISVSLTV